MKSRKNIKSILIIAIIGVTSLFFFNKSLAANTAKIIVETANIRKAADSNSTIVEQAFKEQEVEVLEKTGEWYKVKYNNIEGYLRQDLLKLNNEEQSNNTEVSNTETLNKANNSEEANKKESTVDANSENLENMANYEQSINTEKETTQIGMYTVKEVAKLRIIPLINANEIKEINKDITVNVLEINNNWALVESGSNRGWIVFNKLQKVENVAETNQEENKEEEKQEEQQEETKEVTMYVNSEVVNLRKEESTSSESLGKLTKATQVTVISEANGWSKVKVNGKEGYISSSLLSENKPEVTTSRSLEEARKELEKKEEQKTSSEPAIQSNSQKGADVVACARKYIGCKYVYGGTSPSTGFDCSGFTQYVYKQFGVTLNRTAEAQASNGTAVSKSQLQPGDLVIFTSHVGIYAGNGTFIHAANPQKGVITTSMSDSYYTKNYITARRIFN